MNAKSVRVQSEVGADVMIDCWNRFSSALEQRVSLILSTIESSYWWSAAYSHHDDALWDGAA